MTVKINLKELEQVILNEMSWAENNQMGSTVLIADLEGVKVSLTINVSDDDFIGDEMLCVFEEDDGSD